MANAFDVPDTLQYEGSGETVITITTKTYGDVVEAEYTDWRCDTHYIRLPRQPADDKRSHQLVAYLLYCRLTEKKILPSRAYTATCAWVTHTDCMAHHLLFSAAV